MVASGVSLPVRKIARSQVRWYASRPTKGVSSKPFMSQLESATSRQRSLKKRVVRNGDDSSIKPPSFHGLPPPRKVLEAGGVYEAYNYSATSEFRRRNNLRRDDFERSGSIVAASSATALAQRYRQEADSKSAAGEGVAYTKKTNPSVFAIPVTEQAVKAAADLEKFEKMVSPQMPNRPHLAGHEDLSEEKEDANSDEAFSVRSVKLGLVGFTVIGVACYCNAVTGSGLF